MTDYVPSDRIQTPEWQDRLRPGDTVSFRFPVAEEAGGPEPKARPCLVVDVRKIDGLRHAIVAYGTSRRTKANCGHEVEVRGGETRIAAGLDRRTRFVGARRVTVALDDPAFVTCRRLDTPILGCLIDRPLQRLEKLREEFGADLGSANLSPEAPRVPQPTKQETARRHRTWPRLATAHARIAAQGPAVVGREIPA